MNKAWRLRAGATGAVMILALAAFADAPPEATRPILVTGKLENVQGKSLVLKLRRPKDGQAEVSVPTDAATTFIVNGDPGTLADLQPGMGIAAREVEPEAGQSNGALRVTATSAGVSGTLVKVDGSTLVLEVTRHGGDPTQVQVSTDEKTQVVLLSRLPGEGPAMTLADLKPGMHVRAVPDIGTAKKVFAMPMRAKPTTQRAAS